MINDFSLVELKKIVELIDCFDDIDIMREQIQRRIDFLTDERNKTINIRFDRDNFIDCDIFTREELSILDNNGIDNMQKLIDCDLDSLVGIKPSIKRELAEKRIFFDMREYPKNSGGKRK